MPLFDKEEKAFGLDISDTSLRLVQLEKKTKRTQVQLYNELTLPKDCIRNVKSVKII